MGAEVLRKVNPWLLTKMHPEVLTYASRKIRITANFKCSILKIKNARRAATRLT